MLFYMQHSIKDSNDDKENRIYITLESNDLKKSISFNTTTYYKLQYSNFDKTVNPVLASLSDEHKRQLFEYYQAILNYIDDATSENFLNTIKNIVELTTQVFRNNHIDEAIYHYVKSEEFKYPDLKIAGSRAHDREKLTFRLDDYVFLTGLCVLCKLMSPIWGKLFKNIKSKDKLLTGSDNKEYYCAELFSEFLEKSIFNRVYYKLKYFSDNTIDSTFKYDDKTNSSEFMITARGISIDKFKYIIFSTILVKTLVSYNPFVNAKNINDLPNIMSIINSAIKDTISGRIAAWRNSNTVLPRFSLENTLSEDEDNTSQLDNNSHSSTKTFDIPILVKIGVESSIKKWLKNNNIDVNLFDAAVDYYMLNTFNFSVYNESICSSVIVTQLQLPSNAYKYVEKITYVELITISQIIMLSLSSRPVIVSMLLTSKTSKINNTSIEEKTKYDALTRALSKNGRFQACKRLFPEQVYSGENLGNKRIKISTTKFENQIKNMLFWVLDNVQRINIAPTIWDIVHIDKTRFINGDKIDFEMNDVINLYEVFMAFHG